MAMVAKVRFVLDPSSIERVAKIRKQFPQMTVGVEPVITLDASMSIHLDTWEQFAEMATKIADELTKPEQSDKETDGNQARTEQETATPSVGDTPPK